MLNKISIKVILLFIQIIADLFSLEEDNGLGTESPALEARDPSWHRSNSQS